MSGKEAINLGPELRERLNNFVRGSANQSAPSRKSLPGILSGPADLEGSIIMPHILLLRKLQFLDRHSTLGGLQVIS